MIESSKENSLEREIKPADCVVILGRGIEQVETKKGKEWKPTGAIERLTEKGWHSGIREKELTPDAEGNVVIAGSNANVIAAVELFEELKKRKIPPKLIIFAAGRPAYLEQEEDKTLTEGKILSKKFTSEIKSEDKVEMTILDKNKYTKDDIVESLRLSLDKGLHEITFITISLHKDRAEEFLKIVYSEHPELRKVSGRFIASEDLLSRRYSRSPSAMRLYTKHLEELKKSPAWKLTEAREKKGISDLRSGKYQTLQGPEK